MTTKFPEALDTFDNPSPDSSQAAVRTHSAQHSDANDALEALQAKVGVDLSEDPESLDFKLGALENLTDGLGSAAFQPVASFASSAQGLRADSAVQPAILQAAADELQGQIDSLVDGQQTSAIYADTLEDLQAVVGTYVGQGAFVNNGDGTGQYIWDGAAWQFSRADVLTQKADLSDLDDRVPKIPVAAQRVPVLVDDVRNVPVWLHDGLLDASGIGPVLGDSILNSMIEEGVSTQKVPVASSLVPVMWDSAGNVPAWLEDGLFGVSGLAPSTLALIQAAVQRRQYGTAFQTPLHTDGRTLWRFRSKIARLRTGSSLQANAAVVGDSYAQLPPIPQAFADVLREKHGEGSQGWMTAGEQTWIDGITATFVGAWTLYDVTGTAPTMGCGPDGQARSTVADGARWVFNGVDAEQFRVHYVDTAGAFEVGYYVSGTPTWTAVVGGDTEERRSVTIDVPAGATQIEIRRTSGLVYVLGFEGLSPSRDGVTFNPCGNSGSVSANLIQASSGYDILQAMDVDLIFNILGTNDAAIYLNSTEFIQNLDTWITDVRTRLPGVGIVLVAPPRTGNTNRSDLVMFRNALYDLAIARSCEFFSIYDEWGTYAEMNALGMFADAVHPGPAGARYIADRILHTLGI
ncbi:SGNH/GDSL hydrolase family protein [Stenotrophomonas tumulicola]|uniref:SGNH hydrolase-type esterase domain-containing protein n=1 Tax=Stenotrophomonas tumulicola TaxID=1685415 RepID=A0A7W3IGS4_9GAMM|nr:GDSL-type esterase/lipase family protein [Stenotrophomonas tumulicola]MBA8680526.1 hypothetical protein [Stenotrophomonas tumulicola]